MVCSDGPHAATSFYQIPWIHTPLIESAALSKVAGCRIFLKLENLQPSGSFKSRGIGNLILQHLRSRHTSDKSIPHFYSSSGGNAGLACVTAATTLGFPSTVVVPLSTKPHMIDKIKLAGASQLVQYGATWFEADQHLRNDILPKDPDGVYVPPFDHLQIWQGNATLITEIEEQLGSKADAVVCSVGGGGLFSGIMRGLEGNTTTRSIAVETQGAESLHAALEANELVSLPGITSLATSLGALRVSQQAFEDGKKGTATSIVVTDEEACRSCVRFAEDERMLVEAACGATLTIAYERKVKDLVPNFDEEKKVVLIVCGGKNISLEMLNEWKEKYAV